MASTLLGGCLFVAGLWLPLFLLASSALRRLKVSNDDCVLFAMVFTFPTLCAIYILRSVLPVAELTFDVTISLGLWLAAFKIGAVQKNRLGQLAGPKVEYGIFCAMLIAFYLLPSLGNQVESSDAVAFYGLSFVDFSNLRGVVNLLKISDGLPSNSVAGTGVLAYHWLYFCVPAWVSEVFGMNTSARGALYFSNAIVAFVFLRVLARFVAIFRGGASKTEPLGAFVAVTMVSALYFYQFLIGRMGITWLTTGNRNNLLGQLHNTIGVFGNNTLALAFVCIMIFSLLQWNLTGQRVYVSLAAGSLAVVALLSITLVPGLAVGVGVACFVLPIRKPFVTLAHFAVCGVIAVGMAGGAGMLSGGNVSTSLAWDHGQFLQNIILAFLPGIAGLVLASRQANDKRVLKLTCILLVSTILLPSVIFIGGGIGASSHMSMKNASLLQMLLAPPLYFALCKAVSDVQEKRHLTTSLGVIGLALIGLVNSVAYAASTPVGLMFGRKADVTLTGSHFRALQYLEANTAQQSLVIDELSDKIDRGNPVVNLGGRRVAIPNSYNMIWGDQSDEALCTELEKWRAWRDSGLDKNVLSEYFAGRAHYLLTHRICENEYWKIHRQFGDVRLYQSTRPVVERRKGE